MVWDSGCRVVTFAGRDILKAARDMSVAEARSLVQLLGAYEMAPAEPAANLYRCRWLPGEGYMVYRHCFDEDKCSLLDGIKAHAQACFLNEIAALDYCRYRNALIDRNGTDVI